MTHLNMSHGCFVPMVEHVDLSVTDPGFPVSGARTITVGATLGVGSPLGFATAYGSSNVIL